MDYQKVFSEIYNELKTVEKEESTSLDEEILKRVVFLETKISRLENNLQTIAGLLRDMIENQRK